MRTFASIKKSIDALEGQMREYIRSRYGLRDGNPHLQRIFLLHGDSRLISGLDNMPATSLLGLCTALDGAERKAKEEAAAARKKAAEKKVKAREAIVIYTDGGYSNLYGLGAGAYVILKGGHLFKKGGDRLTGSTNNAAELYAIQLALKAAPRNTDIEIRSDSQYAIGVLTGWNAKKNTQLIEDIKTLATKKRLNVTYSWVKGHSGDRYNEMCDRMCDQIAGTDLNIEYEKYKNRKPCRRTSFSKSESCSAG